MTLPSLVFLRPHETLSAYEMDYVSLLGDAFDLKVVTVGDPAIGGMEHPFVRRLRWPDEFPWRGRRRSFLNALYARRLGRRYHIPGLVRELAGVALVQAGEAASECSYQAARLKERFGYKLLLSASENQPIFWDRSAAQEERIRYVLERVDHVFAIPEEARDRLIEAGLAPEKITIIGHGVDCERFRPAPPKSAIPGAGGRVGASVLGRDRMSQEAEGTAWHPAAVAPPPDRPVTIGYCGRFRAEKGLDILVEATRGLECDCVLLGDGPDRDRLMRLTCDRPRVRILDPLPYDAMQTFYHRIGIFVLPSVPLPGLVEQFGFVIIEAMASGIPVVASTIGGIPRVLGDAGVLIPPGDVEALRGAIRELLGDPARRLALGEEGRARALAHFRREDVAARMAAVYRRLLA
jgi:glycosyltransferase involved in cell wall biosynthesis